jgi:hypothetical protein
VTLAKNRKAPPTIGKTHDDIRTFPDVSNVPWPMSNGEDDETTPDTSVRNMETDPALVASYGATRNTTDVGTVRNADEMEIEVTFVGYT